MKINYKILFAFFMALSFATTPSFAIKPVKKEIKLEDKSNMSLTDILESKVDRKLTFIEKVSLRLLNKKMKKQLAHVIQKEDKCATIVMKNGDLIQAELIQVTSKDVKYKRCNKEDDVEFLIDKSEILSIKAADGEMIYRNSNARQEFSNNDNGEQKTHGLAIASLVLGILSLITPGGFGLALIMGILGVVFGVLAGKKIRKEPNKYKGKKMAKAGLICGIIALALLTVVSLIVAA